MRGKGKVFIISLIVTLTVGVLTLPALWDFSARSGLAALRKEGLNVRAESLSSSLTGVSAQKLLYTLSIPTKRRFPTHIPFPLVLSQVNLSLSIRPLEYITPRILLDGDFLNGRVRASVATSLRGPSIHGTIENVTLSSHPQLRGMGLKDGRLSASVSGLVVGTGRPSASQLTVNLQGVLFELSQLLPSIIPIEALEISDASIKASIQDSGNLDLQSISLTTNIGSLFGSATGRLSPDLAIENLSGTIDIKMTGRDSDRVRNWLPLLIGKAVPSSRQSFSCTLRTVRCDSTGLIMLNRQQCLTYQCH